jgi:hypothetical protein
VKTAAPMTKMESEGSMNDDDVLNVLIFLLFNIKIIASLIKLIFYCIFYAY